MRRRQCTVTLRWIPVLVLAQLGTLGLIQAQPKNQEHWVATWATAQTLVRQAPARPPAPPPPPPASPAADPPPPPGVPPPAGPATTAQTIGARGLNNQTVRMIVRTSVAGRRLRVRLSNAFGGTPVVL